MCSNSHSNSWTVINNNNTSNCNLHSSDSKNSLEIIAVDRFTNNNSQRNLQNMKQNRKTDVYSSFDQYFKAKLLEYNEIEIAKKRRQKIYEKLGQLIKICLLLLVSSAFVIQYLCLLQNTTALSQPTSFKNFNTNLTTYPMMFERKSQRKSFQTPATLWTNNTTSELKLPKVLEPVKNFNQKFGKLFIKSDLIHLFCLYLLTIIAISLLILHGILLKRNQCNHNFARLLNKIHDGYQQMLDENKRRLFEELPFYGGDSPNYDNFEERRLKIRQFPSNFHRHFCRRITFLRRQLRNEMAVVRNMKHVSQQSKNERVRKICRKYMQQMRRAHRNYVLQLNELSEVLLRHQQRRQAILASIQELENRK